MEHRVDTARASGRFREGLWRLADPKISITSLAAALVGTAVAIRDGAFAPGWLLVGLLAMFAMEVAKNAWGEIFDFDTGVDQAVAPEDRTPFSGGKRVLVENLLTRRQTWAIAIGFGAAGVALGAAIVVLHAPAALWVGVIGLALGWSYHGPPLRLVYRGLGELDVVLCYGPLLVQAAYVIQANRLSLDALFASLPLGLLIAAFLVVNEFPDYRADVAAGKRNLVARLGRRRARWLLVAIDAAAFGTLAVLPLVGELPGAVLAGSIGLPFAIRAARIVWLDPEGFHRTRPAQPAALLAFCACALGTALGIGLG